MFFTKGVHVKLLVKSLSVVATVSAAALLAMGINTFFHQNEAVASTANTLTGSCGGVLSFQKRGKPWEFDKGGVNVFFRIDFSQQSAHFAYTVRSIDKDKHPKGYETLSAIKYTYSSNDVGTGLIPGSFSIKFTDPLDNSQSSLHIMPVNEGNTYLIHVFDDDVTGICQRI